MLESSQTKGNITVRADRLLSVLLLLQARGRMTARELAQRLEVSDRTIYRDIDALSAAGVPVYAEPGPGGGYALAEGYRTSLTGMVGDEVRGLFMSGIPRPLVELGFGKVLETALLKLLAALPAEQQQAADRARERVYLDAGAWFRPPDAVPHLHTMQDAVWRDQRVRLSYRRRSGALGTRVVEPYGLVAKAGVWYLVGATPAGLRVFRVARVAAVAETGERFVRPRDFDLQAYWTRWSTRFEASKRRYAVVVRVAEVLTPELPRLFGEALSESIEDVKRDGVGHMTFQLRFPTLDEACAMLLSVATEVEVLQPAELREQLVERATAIARYYTNGPQYGPKPPSRTP